MKRQSATNATAFASTFYFFSSYKTTAIKNKKSLQATAHNSADIGANSNDRAMNVKRLEQSVCGLRTTSLRIDSSGDAHNIRLKEIIFLRALFGYPSVSK